MKNISKIEKYFIKEYKLDENVDYPIKTVDARKLVTHKRIDLIAKIKYIESIELDYQSDFFEKLYKASIESFSDGSFKEPGKEDKDSFEKYKSDFISLIQDIKKSGFDNSKSIVPVSKNNIIVDGAHRTSICTYFGKKIDTIILPVTCNIYDLNYFKSKKMDDIYLDYLCLEYSKYKKNVHAICLWPKCSSDNIAYIEKIINNSFDLVYKKEISFSYNGLKNFMTQIYSNFDWVGNIDNKFNGVYNKLNKCYNEKNNTIIYVIEEENVDKILKIKNQIRNEIGIGNHSIHSTDSYDETIQLLQMVLNENTINFLNVANPYNFKKFLVSLNDFKNDMISNNIPLNDILIDGSSILTAYGLRNNDDIDVIINQKYLKYLPKKYDIHNNELSSYDETVSNILYNPSNYIYFNDIKFISLQSLKKKKEIRSEKKDIDDIVLINSVLVKPSIAKVLIIKLKRRICFITNKFKLFIVPILQKYKIYGFIKRIVKGDSNE